MTNTCALCALWVGLAWAATLRAIWFKGSTALSKIAVQGHSERRLLPIPPAGKKSAQEVPHPIDTGGA
jgi:hypothetical protein